MAEENLSPRHSSRSFCAFAHRLPPRRQRPHFYLQLALCPPQPRDHGAAPGRHRCRAQHRGQRSIHLRRAALAGPELGRRVQAVGAACAAPRGRPKRSSPRASPIATSRPPTPATAMQSSAQGAWLCNPGMREMSREESDRRAAAGEPFALRYRVPRGDGPGFAFCRWRIWCAVQARRRSRRLALLRSDGMPTYHLASCVDDADLRISHIIRGQDHLTNTFKHLLIFEALGARAAPIRASSPARCTRWHQALQAQARPCRQRHDLSRCRFPASGFHQFSLPAGLVAQERSRVSHPGRDSPQLFTLEGVNRSNAVVNFTEEDPFDRRLCGSMLSIFAPCRSRSSATPRAILRTGRLSSIAEKAARGHAAHPRAHQVAARCRRRRRLFLCRPSSLPTTPPS